jgi:sensor histidine kinase YesM
MKKHYRLLIIIGAVIAGGAFFSFLTLRDTDSWGTAVFIGASYSILIVGSVLVVYRFTSVRFSIFPTIPRWILQAVSLTVSVSFAYLVGLIIQTFVLTPAEVLSELLTDTLWDTFVGLITAPFSQAESAAILTTEVRGLIFTVVAVLFLIGLISLVGSFIEVRWQENKQRVMIDRAELTALRAQMEPHFLFNSLNTIAAMTQKDPRLAEDLILQLSDILRYHYENAGTASVDLQAELKFIEKYLELISLRFKDQLKINLTNTSQKLKQTVPAFLIQPLVENCIRHAWQGDGRVLHLEIKVEDNTHGTTITVADDGTGIDADSLNKVFEMNHALANLAERLKLFYNKRNLLGVYSKIKSGTTVTIKLPGK